MKSNMTMVLTNNGEVVEGDPLEYLQSVVEGSNLTGEAPFQGGAIGFVGYDLLSLMNRINILWHTIGTLICIFI